MDIQLSKKADILICLIYKNYKNALKNGISLNDAKFLHSSNDIQKSIIPKWSPDDVNSICCELDQAGLLDIFYADDIAYSIELSTSGIIYMENRFKNNFKELLDYIEKFKSFII